MMKTMIRFSMLLFMGIAFLATSQAQDAKEKEMTKWDDAKEAYHKVMAGTFHPAEEGDYMPLKEKAHELHKSAKHWASLSIPDGLNKDALKKNLKMLVSGSADMEKLVKKEATDDELKKAIFSLHDVFHEIVGLCDH